MAATHTSSHQPPAVSTEDDPVLDILRGISSVTNASTTTMIPDQMALEIR